jgi:putative hydrolase of the HAD superfamily
LATNAENSTEAQIRLALKRAGLSEYIGHVFCRENLDVRKADPSYYQKITDKLNVNPEQVTMVGDPLERDVHPEIKVGIKAFWFNPNGNHVVSGILAINKLDLLT